MMVSNEMTEARAVLDLEAQALQILAKGLDTSFVQALDAIDQSTGRCIVTGIGKSGHIARKIASTFSSTGCPSFFVHPSEANHGDLGMIHQDDVVILLSNSGETTELFATISYCKLHQIPIICITSKDDSTLAKKSNIVLLLPHLREACPLGLAPMTSTTMMLALGDALAAVLLQRKNFSPTDFKTFHPGGALGQRLKSAAQIMHVNSDMPLAFCHTSMPDILIEMTSKRFGCVGIIDSHQQLIGVITDGDLRRHINDNLFSMTAQEIMTLSPKTLHTNAMIEEAIAIMKEKKITSLFITEKDSAVPIGIINIHDCLKSI